VRRIVISVVLGLGVATGFAYGQDKQGALDDQFVRFALPPPQALSFSKPVKCAAIASSALYQAGEEPEDLKQNKLIVKVKKGTDRLKLWLEDETLIVQVRDEKPDRYRISGHQNKWLSAVHYGGLMPTVYSISVNENNGFAVWSLNEPMFFPASEYPYTQSVYLHCTN